MEIPSVRMLLWLIYSFSENMKQIEQIVLSKSGSLANIDFRSDTPRTIQKNRKMIKTVQKKNFFITFKLKLIEKTKKTSVKELFMDFWPSD